MIYRLRPSWGPFKYFRPPTSFHFGIENEARCFRQGCFRKQQCLQSGPRQGDSETPRSCCCQGLGKDSYQNFRHSGGLGYCFVSSSDFQNEAWIILPLKSSTIWCWRDHYMQCELPTAGTFWQAVCRQVGIFRQCTTRGMKHVLLSEIVSFTWLGWAIRIAPRLLFYCTRDLNCGAEEGENRSQGIAWWDSHFGRRTNHER